MREPRRSFASLFARTQNATQKFVDNNKRRSSKTTMKEGCQPVPPNQAVLFPAFTWNYRVVKGELGFGLVASRKIKKGELVFSDSLEFSFCDVLDGDQVLFDRHQKASRICRETIPKLFPLTRDTLLRTHGVPTLNPDPSGESAGIVSWRLEVPGMLMNHSCDPNVVDYPPCSESGEGYAACDIKKGEELTCDYTFQYYDEGPLFEVCKCGASNCRGSMMGFKALTDAQKKELFPYAAKSVQAMHRADTGEGLPVIKQQVVFPPRNTDGDNVLRLVCPGPSSALADVVLKPDESGDGMPRLLATKDFEFGQRVFEFWCQPWPQSPQTIDIVAASPIIGLGDQPEGTVIRINAPSCAPRHRNGEFKFSAWELLTTHSCDPNLVYNDEDSDEEEDWRSSYAAKNIKAGDPLTVDFNTMLWDRTEFKSEDDDMSCHCGAAACTGTVKGFKFLTPEEQQARKLMTWKRVPPPYEGVASKVTPGLALAAHVREKWQTDPNAKVEAPEMDSSSDSSSSSDDE